MYDVVIVGAGPAGLFSAYELIQNNPKLKVLLLDEGRFAKSAGFLCGADAFPKRVVGYLFYDSYGLSGNLLFGDFFLQTLCGFYGSGNDTAVSFYQG